MKQIKVNLKQPLLFCGALTASVVLSTIAAQATPVISPAEVHNGPGSAYTVIAEIPASADVRVLGCYSGWEGGWCQIRYKKLTGYVDAGALAPSGTSNVIVAPIVTADTANLRRGPGTNWPSLAVIPAATALDVTHCSQGWLYGWCKVSYEGQTGYVNSVLLKRQGAVYAQ